MGLGDICLYITFPPGAVNTHGVVLMGGSIGHAYMFMLLLWMLVIHVLSCTATYHSQVQFCQFTLKLHATDPTAEWQLKLAALMKTCSIGAGKLKPLQHEEWILGKDIKEFPKHKVDDKYLQDFIAARKLVTDMTKGDNIESFSDVLSIIKANQSSLLAADRSFNLEIELLSFAPAALENTIKDKLLDILPSETKHITMKNALMEIQALKHSDLIEKSSHSSKGQLEAFEEAVAKMIRGVSPDPGEAQTCSYYAKVLNALQWFCEAQSGPKGQMKKLLRGEAALNYLFKQMAAKMEKSENKVTLAHLEVIMGQCTITMAWCPAQVCFCKVGSTCKTCSLCVAVHSM